jgi:ATP-dependent DNA ligase
MLSTSARRWPNAGHWVLQPKWDGFRLLVDIDGEGRVRGWSRHGINLTARLRPLLARFEGVAPGTTFDGELVAVSERAGQPTQDFAAVTRAVFTGDSGGGDGLRFVAFDLLRVGGRDVRARPWRERDAQLRDVLPVSERIRLINSQAATSAAHDAIVALGFEGTVLKRPSSTYRAGRHAAWVKHKARLTTTGEVLSVRQDRDGRWHALCEVDERRVAVFASADTTDLIGELVELVYSRVDANGGLREARIIPPPMQCGGHLHRPEHMTTTHPTTASKRRAAKVV